MNSDTPITQESLKSKVWWSYIHEDIQELLKESALLLSRVPNWGDKFHDYAFIVFPAAKAYEGFLKKLFLDMGFITNEDYYGKRFRVGKALNPALEKHLREGESVYDKIEKFCGGKELADKLWETWRTGRNAIFHWFPEEKNAISAEEARNIISAIIHTMDFAFRECKI